MGAMRIQICNRREKFFGLMEPCVGSGLFFDYLGYASAVCLPGHMVGVKILVQEKNSGLSLKTCREHVHFFLSICSSFVTL